MKEDNFKLQEQLTTSKGKLIELQSVAVELSGSKSENTRLKGIIEKQQEKVADYDREVAANREHAEKLERMIRKIQDEKLSSTVCNGIYNASFEVDFHLSVWLRARELDSWETGT